MLGQALYAVFVVFSGITMTGAHNTALLLPCVVSILRASFCLRIKRKSEAGALEFWITRLSQDKG